MTIYRTVHRKNKWRKRGLAIVPVKFNLGFPGKTLNQAAALVMIYKDGSVLLTHAGVELGQGVQTKLAQVFIILLYNIPSASALYEFALNEDSRFSKSGALTSRERRSLLVHFIISNNGFVHTAGRQQSARSAHGEHSYRGDCDGQDTECHVDCCFFHDGS